MWEVDIDIELYWRFELSRRTLDQTLAEQPKLLFCRSSASPLHTDTPSQEFLRFTHSGELLLDTLRFEGEKQHSDGWLTRCSEWIVTLQLCGGTLYIYPREADILFQVSWWDDENSRRLCENPFFLWMKLSSENKQQKEIRGSSGVNTGPNYYSSNWREETPEWPALIERLPSATLLLHAEVSRLELLNLQEF